MKRYLPLIVLVGCAALFVFGLVQLFELRFEGGDVYPAYSSLRADPLGTMAFYESLGKMPGVTVRRDFSESDVLPEEPDTVYLHLAAESYEWDEMPVDAFHDIKDFLARGGRLVITAYPQTETFHPFTDDEDKTNSIKSAKGSKKTPDKTANKKKMVADDEESLVSLTDEWGFHSGFKELVMDVDTYQPVSVMNRSDLPLPDALDWHSGMVFTNCDSAWQTIYARGTNAVVIERQFGKGSVVIASDSYFLSNEAMDEDRHADFLAWVVGSGRNVVFDEAHLGIVETSGVAALMRKYRLHGLAAGLLLLAGLFIWKNSVSLVPPHVEEKQGDFVTGKDSASGFVNLLRRSVAPPDLLAVCYEEWKKGSGTAGQASSARLQQAATVYQTEQSLSPRERNVAAAYRKISEIIGRKNKKL